MTFCLCSQYTHGTTKMLAKVPVSVVLLLSARPRALHVKIRYLARGFRQACLGSWYIAAICGCSPVQQHVPEAHTPKFDNGQLLGCHG